ncbi:MULTISPECIES: thioredoxin family protein [unclassified Anabaena]|uniref:thioredoxin family protein n=1 Tax=unclassified Anabaena TaxID=2619674 RepID=UPI000833817B|nr:MULTISPECIES: thioredoxin family protein [unclassified Anabaena]
MLKVEILGKGCQKCHQLEANTREAIATLGIDAELTHITDPIAIAQRGIMTTPALAINGKVVSKGQVLPPTQIQTLLQ